MSSRIWRTESQIAQIRRILDAPTMANSGGPVLDSVKVFPIFGGAWWLSNGILAAQLEGFFDFVLTSSLIDMLSEYDPGHTLISHGTRYKPSVYAWNSEPGANGTVTDSQVQAALQDWIAKPTFTGLFFPQPSSNTLYFIYLPPGVTSIEPKLGKKSCDEQGGYHWRYSDPNHPGNVFYVVLPYCKLQGRNLRFTHLD